MNMIKTLEERISEALYPGRNDNVAREPPSDDQVTPQSSQGTGHSKCLQTEFGEVCLATPGEQRLPQPIFEGIKGVEAASAAHCLRTEFGEVKLVRLPQEACSLPTEFGEVRVTGTTPGDSPAKPATEPSQDQPERTRQKVLATPPSTPQASMSYNQQSQKQQSQQNQQGRNPLRPSISSATREMHDSSASQPQSGNREYQPICSSKTFITTVDQPIEKEIIEVIREHRLYEKRFVVETRPAGERELTDRQNEEELGTRVVMGKATAPSGPCEKAPELVVRSR